MLLFCRPQKELCVLYLLMLRHQQKEPEAPRRRSRRSKKRSTKSRRRSRENRQAGKLRASRGSLNSNLKTSAVMIRVQQRALNIRTHLITGALGPSLCTAPLPVRPAVIKATCRALKQLCSETFETVSFILKGSHLLC